MKQIHGKVWIIHFASILVALIRGTKLYLFSQFRRRRHHVHWWTSEWCCHCRWCTAGVRRGCECTEMYPLSLAAHRRTCNEKPRREPVPIAHSCRADEPHASAEQYRWVASRYAVLWWIPASAACTEWSLLDDELSANYLMLALFLWLFIRWFLSLHALAINAHYS